MDQLLDEMKRVWNEDSDRMRDLSHCRGYGRWKDTEAWYIKNGFKLIGKIGSFAGDGVGQVRQGHGPRIIDFGCGGGSTIMALNGVSKNYDVSIDITGIDISHKNIVAAQRIAPEARYVLYDGANPEELKTKIMPRADIFICTYVFQHFPTEEYAKRIIALLPHFLVKGGLFIIQTRCTEGDTTFKDGPYKQNFIYRAHYNVEEFKRWLQEVGCDVQKIEMDAGQEDYAWHMGVMT